MADYALRIVEQFPFHASVSFGLSITGPSTAFPLVLGCSLRTHKGQVVDIAARYIDSAGMALWHVDADQRFRINEMGRPDDGWSGSVIFALWRDRSFSERIADTGWYDWSAPWLIGASIVGIEANERSIQARYAGRAGAIRRSSALETLVPPFVPQPTAVDPTDEARSRAIEEAAEQGVDMELRGAWVKKRTADIAERRKKKRLP